MTLPDINQQPINYVDATPDEGYPLRILRTYRANCDCRWVSELENPLIQLMNKNQEERAKILDVAIATLEKSIGSAHGQGQKTDDNHHE